MKRLFVVLFVLSMFQLEGMNRRDPWLEEQELEQAKLLSLLEYVPSQTRPREVAPTRSSVPTGRRSVAPTTDTSFHYRSQVYGNRSEEKKKTKQIVVKYNNNSVIWHFLKATNTLPKVNRDRWNLFFFPRRKSSQLKLDSTSYFVCRTDAFSVVVQVPTISAFGRVRGFQAIKIAEHVASINNFELLAEFLKAPLLLKEAYEKVDLKKDPVSFDEMKTLVCWGKDSAEINCVHVTVIECEDLYQNFMRKEEVIAASGRWETSKNNGFVPAPEVFIVKMKNENWVVLRIEECSSDPLLGVVLVDLSAGSKDGITPHYKWLYEFTGIFSPGVK